MSLVDYFDMRSLMDEYVYYLIGSYVLLYFGLNYFARNAGNGMANPITKIPLANWLHAGSVVIFALSFFLYHKKSHDYVYLILISFPMDIFAAILAMRAFPVQRRKSDLIDEE